MSHISNLIFDFVKKRRAEEIYLVSGGDINKFLCVLGLIHQLFVARTVSQRK